MMKLPKTIHIIITFLASFLLASCNANNELAITKNVITQLKEFRTKSKFFADESFFYPGAPDEKTRLKAENIMNDLSASLAANIESNPNKNYVLMEFKKTLLKFNEFDSEERDRVCHYLEELMDILEIKSSEGLINDWRYGINSKTTS